MTVDEAKKRLKEMGSAASLSLSEKTEVEDMYLEVLDKKFTRTSCSDCYRDAIIEMSVYLNKNGAMKEKREYKVKNGILLQLEFGSSDFYTNDNLTDEVAEAYLDKYPENISWFAEYPENWKERIEAKGYEEELVARMVESMKGGLTAQAVEKDFSDYRYNGKKISKKRLLKHVNRALEVLASEGEEDEPQQNDETETTTE